MHVRLELSGGLELLFGNKKQHDLDLPENSTPADGSSKWTVGALLPWLREKLLTERPELFMKGNSVRPGILVLINDCDWELRYVAARQNAGLSSGTLESELHEGDTVTFISTLHGG